MNYYNDNDKFCCKWLQNLIDAKLIPEGKVDDRSITDIAPNDLKGFKQCHFFAGCGGWPIALRLAGWPDDREIWTGSCPCEPFSTAGKGHGIKDERHLWPAFRWLIAQKKPSVVTGEQVAKGSAIEWMSGVHLDLEAIGYSVDAYDLAACSVGAWHIRQRLFWLANSDGPGWMWSGPTQPEKWWRDLFRAWYGQALSDTDSTGRTNTERREGPSRKVWREGFMPDLPGRGIRKWEPEPDVVRVVHGLSRNARAVSAYGRAIVPQLAAEFIMAYNDSAIR